MTLEEFLKNILTEVRDNPKDTTVKQYRAYYQLQDKKIPLSGWFSKPELAIENAKKYIEGGLLEGKTFDFTNEDGSVEELVSDDKYSIITESGIIEKLKNLLGLGALGTIGANLGNLKDAVASFFNFKDGKLLFRGTEDEITDGLFTSFGGFLDNASDVDKENNLTLLDNSVKVAKRLGGEEFSLDDISLLLNNQNKDGEKLVTRLVSESNDELKEENQGLKNWFLNKYYVSGMNNKLFKSTSLLRDKFAELATNAKTGDLAKLGLVAGSGLGLSKLKDLRAKWSGTPERTIDLEKNIEARVENDINKMEASMKEAEDEASKKAAGVAAATTGALGAGASALKGLGDDAVKGVDTLKDKAVDLKDGAIDTVGKGVDTVKDTVADLSSNVASTVDKGADTIKSGVSEVKDDASKLDAAAVGAAGTAVDGVKNVGINLKDKVSDFGKDASAKVGEGVDAIKSGVNDVKDEAGKLGAAAVGAAGTAAEGVKNVGINLKDKVSDFGKDASAKVGEGVDAKKSGVNDVKDEAGKLGAAAAGTAGKAVEGVKNVGIDLKDKALDFGKDASAKVDKGIDNIAHKLNDDDDKKKGGAFKKWAIGAGVAGLASLPFWAIPYGINAEIPEGATVTKELPSNYRFYQNVELPEVKQDGYTFDGWYSDSNFNNKVDNIHFGLGTKNLYPKLTQSETATVEPDKETAPANDAVATLVDTVKSKADDFETKINDAKTNLDELNALPLDGVELPSGLEIDKINKDFETLTTNFEGLKTRLGGSDLTEDDVNSVSSDLDALTTDLDKLNTNIAEATKFASEAPTNAESETATSDTTSGDNSSTGSSDANATDTTSGDNSSTGSSDTSAKDSTSGDNSSTGSNDTSASNATTDTTSSGNSNASNATTSSSDDKGVVNTAAGK